MANQGEIEQRILKIEEVILKWEERKIALTYIIDEARNDIASLDESIELDQRNEMIYFLEYAINYWHIQIQKIENEMLHYQQQIHVLRLELGGFQPTEE